MLILRLKTEVSLDGLGRRCKGVGGGGYIRLFFLDLSWELERQKTGGWVAFYLVCRWVGVCVWGG